MTFCPFSTTTGGPAIRLGETHTATVERDILHVTHPPTIRWVDVGMEPGAEETRVIDPAFRMGWGVPPGDSQVDVGEVLPPS